MSGLSHTPGKRAWGNTHRGFESRPLRQKQPTPHSASRVGFFVARLPQPDQIAFWACSIFMAESIRVDTSDMLPGTMRVVVASAATRE